MTKMKGLFKGLKCISNIFECKEHEMEIGYPTDVKHVAHIGWDDNASANSPSWMEEFKSSSEKKSPLSDCKPKGNPWTPKEPEKPEDMSFADNTCSEKPKNHKKTKKKKKNNNNNNNASSPTTPSLTPRGRQIRGVCGLVGNTSSSEQMEMWPNFK